MAVQIEGALPHYDLAKRTAKATHRGVGRTYLRRPSLEKTEAGNIYLRIFADQKIH
jgi:hypothetical protein